MSVQELKESIHALIDKIEDEDQLATYLKALNSKDFVEQEIWNDLSIDLQNELLELDKESEKSEDLITNEMVFKRLKR